MHIFDVTTRIFLHPDTGPAKLFRELYLGFNGKPAALNFPVGLGAGNHDWAVHIDWFSQYSAESNIHVTDLIRSTPPNVVSKFEAYFGVLGSTPPHYAVTLGGGKLLVVHLNTSIAEPCRRMQLGRDLYSPGYYGDPSESICPAQEWLRKTLSEHQQRQGESAPIIFVQHYGYNQFGTEMSGGFRGYWWHPNDREIFAEIIKPYNVIALIHGHDHNWKLTKKGEIAADQAVFSSDVNSQKIDVGFWEGRAWIDVNRDGKADYCRVIDANVGTGRVRCALSNGTGFNAIEWTSASIDPGYYEGRSWVDANGDGYFDYCRVIGSNQGTGRVSCLLATSTGFDKEVVSGDLDVGDLEGRAFVDANGDKLLDYCRGIEKNGNRGKVRCALLQNSNGIYSFGAEVTSQETIHLGLKAGIAWVDVDGDQCADYCRTYDGDTLGCRKSAIGNKCGHYAAEITIEKASIGKPQTRFWIDVNQDDFADFCRYPKVNWGNGILKCNLGPSLEKSSCTNPDNCDEERKGPDVGYWEGITWADFDGNKTLDYCRATETLPDRPEQPGRASCQLTSTGGNGIAFGSDIKSRELDPGFSQGRSFADVNGDGRTDFCRVVKSNIKEGELRCTLGGKKTTASPMDSISVPSGFCAPGSGYHHGFAVVRVTNTKLDIAAVEKVLSKCDKSEYAGETYTDPEKVYSQDIWIP